MRDQPLSVTVVGGDGARVGEDGARSQSSFVNCGAPVVHVLSNVAPLPTDARAVTTAPTGQYGFPASCHVHDHVREAMAVHAPDEAYRVWCPNCGYVLAEYMHGVARYLCRSCKWEGVIARHSAFLVVSYTTLRRGAAETQWRKRPPRLAGDHPIT
jgi:ribosomal protein S27AE